MTLNEEDRQRILDIHKKCYGLVALAQKLLAKDGPSYSTEPILREWADKNLRVGDRVEVIKGLVGQYYQTCDGNILEIYKRMRQETPLGINYDNLTRYLTMLNLKPRGQKAAKPGPHKLPKSAKLNRKTNIKKSKYAFCDSPGVI